MDFDVEQFIEDIRWMKKRYLVLGTKFAYEDDQGLVLLDPDDPDDMEPQTPLGAVTVSPEEYEVIRHWVKANFGMYRDKPGGPVRPQRNRDNPRQFSLYGITIQTVNAQALFLEHLDPDSIAAKFTGIDETVYYHNNSPP